MATLAIVTGQPLAHLIGLPPHWLESLRIAWAAHVHDQQLSQEVAKAKRRG